jgi:hypothetical protein
VKVARAAERLTAMSARALADVMDEDDGDVEVALDLAQRAEELSDLARRILVERMKAHQGIEEEEARPELGESRTEALEILAAIEAEARDGDHVEIDRGELETTCSRDRLDALPDDSERILCEVNERKPASLDSEVAESGAAARDTQSHVEPEPGFAGLRRAAEDADGFLRPETVDEKSSRLLFTR